jgi:TPP-dependent pyruvate/acetoin dehydrogenase alpha subunit
MTQTQAPATRVPEIDPPDRSPSWTAPSDVSRLFAAYERMVLIRRFEEEIQRQFLRGEIHGTTHLCNGEEAVFVGVHSALEPGDVVAATYRGHGHALARGIPAQELAAEMMGRSTGTCGGRAGSMNIIDVERGLLGCFGIVGGTLAAATGAALGLRDRGGVAVAGFGEGTANQAYFAECLNFAKVFELPAVFVCENNLYGEFTPWDAVTAGGDVAARAAVLGIPTRRIDGNDVRVVHAAADEAVQRARAGGGPTFLECVTYRHVGHSRSDPGAYRPEGELEAWKEKDPLLRTRVHLESLGVPGDEIDAADARVDEEIADAFAAALAAPYPDGSSAASEYRDA